MSKERASRVGRRELNRESLDALLHVLGPEREDAGQRYEAIRERLLAFFRWRGASAPEALTDETFDRVCRRLAEGETIRTTDVGRYCLGVARRVVSEAWERDRRRGPQEGLDGRARTLASPAELPGEPSPALACLDRCLGALPPETRDLLLLYYECDGREKIDRRREIAIRLALEPNALRIRLHRLRARLEECVRACLGGGGEIPSPPAAPVGRGPRA
jgi:DNA-directed RNA polymerase specialized sigma24 family protein